MTVEHVVMCNQCGAAATPALESEDPRAVAVQEGWTCGEEKDICPACGGAGLRALPRLAEGEVEWA